LTSKVCCRCKKDQDINNFTTNKSVKDGYDGWCRYCVKDAQLLRKYNITLAEYNRILTNQNYKCAICGTNEPLGVSGTFVVDHDHITKKVRGLLCNHCNTGIGKLGDTIESLQKAIDYLKNQETNVV
jgi:DNA-directed RNA polymerase subunit RPC12/RpoP